MSVEIRGPLTKKPKVGHKFGLGFSLGRTWTEEWDDEIEEEVGGWEWHLTIGVLCWLLIFEWIGEMKECY
jgi:hypothetical protein